MSERRHAFAELLPSIIGELDNANGVVLAAIYDRVAETMPSLTDDEVESPPGHGLKWQHDLRWELENLVIAGTVRRRKDLGRAMYSLNSEH